jgi:hypothetical protein
MFIIVQLPVTSTGFTLAAIVKVHVELDVVKSSIIAVGGDITDMGNNQFYSLVIHIEVNA